MSTYTINVDWDGKDALADSATAKIISGDDFQTEFETVRTAVNSKADTASPTLTGTPAAPTAAADTNTTQIATTAFVTTAVGADLPSITDNGDANAMTIDATENIGFPATPSSLHADYTGLQVGGNGTISAQTTKAAGNNLWIGENVREDTSGGEKAISTGLSSQIMMTDGEIDLKMAPSVSADSAVTFETPLNIEAGDKYTVDIGIEGTVLPDANLRLHNHGWATILAIATGTTTNANYVQFHNSNGVVGFIGMSGSTTEYSTTSDYRLKENVVDITDGITRLKTLQPRRFNFITDPNLTLDGFISHEVTGVPESVSGTKDEIETWQSFEELPEGVSVGDNKLDESGNTIPKYQGIDQSKIVPLLTAALQEAVTKIEELTTRVETLENA